MSVDIGSLGGYGFEPVGGGFEGLGPQTQTQERVVLPVQCPQGYWPCDSPIGCTADRRWVREGNCCTCVPLEGGGPPPITAPCAPPSVWDPVQQRCVGGQTDGGGREPDPFQRIGDAITQFLAGGGGGISIPQLPQPQVVAAPVTRSTLSPVAVLLILAGLAGAGWWVYTRTRRRAQ